MAYASDQGHSSGRGLEDSNVQDDAVIVAPELVRDSLEERPRAGADRASDLGGAGEADHVDVLVLHECIANVRAAGEDVEEALRQARGLEELRVEYPSAHRRLWVRLQQNSIAGSN